VNTAGRLAWKQLSFKESVIAHQSIHIRAENLTGLKLYTEYVNSNSNLLLELW